jgi:biotin carboxyl carrier protein
MHSTCLRPGVDVLRDHDRQVATPTKVAISTPPKEDERVATPVNAPMVGKILRIETKIGDRVEEDGTILVMEAMKMEIEVVSPCEGTIAGINVAVGDAVDPDTIVAVVE